jgi:hypothetical protein
MNRALKVSASGKWRSLLGLPGLVAEADALAIAPLVQANVIASAPNSGWPCAFHDADRDRCRRPSGFGTQYGCRVVVPRSVPKVRRRERDASRDIVVRLMPVAITGRATMAPRWAPRQCDFWSSGWRAGSTPASSRSRLPARGEPCAPRATRRPAAALHRRPAATAGRQGPVVGRHRLGEFAGLVTPDTILRW